MRRDDFFYHLPDDLIAQTPPKKRGDSRLLVLSEGALLDRYFVDLQDFLRPGDLLIFNNTQVVPARLFGHKDTGGKVEILLERVMGERSILVQLRASRAAKIGCVIALATGARLLVQKRVNNMFILQLLDAIDWSQLLQSAGHLPLPPYIKRAATKLDEERYQTVYADAPGAVAAPTAGLHFTHSFMQDLQQLGVSFAFVTLHIGAGTFAPVRMMDCTQHSMHHEFLQVTKQVCEKIKQTQANKGRVVAVGTTVVRALETVAMHGMQGYTGETDIFIYPGYEFQVVDALLTNFHLPESTLLMLVAAFAGRKQVLAAYQHAVAEGYRFFSYGDTMFIDKYAL